jgi:hypothetical protein
MGASSIQSARNRACIRQGWQCHYCGLPMLPSSSRRAEQMPGLRCSAEHLVAQRDGGGSHTSNVVGSARRLQWAEAQARA